MVKKLVAARVLLAVFQSFCLHLLLELPDRFKVKEEAVEALGDARTGIGRMNWLAASC